MFEQTTGELIIALVTLYILFNLLIIVVDLVWNWLRLHWIRRENIKTFRELNRHLAVLINRRNLSQADKLQEFLAEKEKQSQE